MSIESLGLMAALQSMKPQLPDYLTDEQLDIIDTVSQMKSNEIMTIDAIAGSGKTTILKHIAEQNPDKRFLYLAFNKAIVAESKMKMPDNVDCRTIHSIAYSVVKPPFVRAREFKYHELEHMFDDWGEFRKFYDEFIQFLLSDDTFEDLIDKNYQYPKDILRLLDQVIKGELEYTHSIYLKIFHLRLLKEVGLAKQLRYDYVMLDEAQDTNKVMLDIIIHLNCPVILVGDTHQNIYQFNKTINALAVVQNITYKKHLTYSFRCPQSILDKATRSFKMFLNKNTIMISQNEKAKLNGKTAFISRTNSRLAQFLLERYDEKDDLNKYYLGKGADEIFKAPLAVYALFEYEDMNKLTLPPEYEYIKRYKRSDFDETYKALKDYAYSTNDAEIIISLLIIKRFTRKGLLITYDIAKQLNNNIQAKYILTNAHIVKGLEFDHVILADDFPDLQDKMYEILRDETYDWNMDYFFKNIPDNFLLEVNLYYVALTRAIKTLEDNTFNSITLKGENANTTKHSEPITQILRQE